MSAGYLEVGWSRALHVRQEYLSLRPDACRLLYISDIHLRPTRSDRLCRQVLDAVRGSQADAILLGGDLVDRATELVPLRHLVSALSDLAPVLAVGGNHDGRVGMERVRQAVVDGGGQWIHGGAAQLTHGTRVIGVSGPDTDAIPRGDVRILCAHNPRVWRRARKLGYELVLAGHLHGCQFVAWEWWDRLFPGAMFYPYCVLSHQRGPSRLVVSRGVSDLVPIRWRCPREVVVCHV